MKSEFEHFLDAVYRCGDAPWMNLCFDLLKRMFNTLSLTENSPQLSMCVRKDKRLTVNIGQRWVLSPEAFNCVGLLMPMAINHESLGLTLLGYFTDKRKDPEAKWVTYKWAEGSAIPEVLYHQWEQACSDELRRTTKSAYRKFHSDLFFNSVIDTELRKKVFLDAYKTS